MMTENASIFCRTGKKSVVVFSFQREKFTNEDGILGHELKHGQALKT
jgi:hypothetical protein